MSLFWVCYCVVVLMTSALGIAALASADRLDRGQAVPAYTVGTYIVVAALAALLALAACLKVLL